MGTALKEMDVEKISAIMDKFESQFETMDVQTGVMDQAMENSMATSTPPDQVDDLVSQVASEHNLDLNEKFGEMMTENPQGQQKQVQDPDNMQSLEQRLADLRSG